MSRKTDKLRKNNSAEGMPRALKVLGDLKYRIIVEGICVGLLTGVLVSAFRLSLVKMDKTSSNLNVESVDINQMIEAILKRLKPIADQKDIDLIYESVREVNAEVDEVKLTLAISNLVENGIKYNKEHGYVKVRLDADHQFFTIDVEDNGIGIPQESIEHIFERFYRVDKSHSTKIGGTGLGLAITRNAILMHRGAIKVESKQESGTTFSIKIPLTYVSK